MRRVLSINTNVGQMAALLAMNAAGVATQLAQNRISTGQKVASPRDDGATFAIAQNIRGQLASYDALSQSRDRALGLLDTTTSGLQGISDLLIQMKKIATDAGDPSLDSASRAALDAEFQDLKSQIDTISKNASFEDQNLLDSSQSTFMHYGPGDRGTSWSPLQYWSGAPTPQPGEWIDYVFGFQSNGSTTVHFRGTQRYGLSYYDGSRWTIAEQGSIQFDSTKPSPPSYGDVVISPSTMYTLPQALGDDVMPSLPANTVEVAAWIALDGQFFDQDDQIAIHQDVNLDPSSTEAETGHPMVLATFAPGGTIQQNVTDVRAVEINSRQETLNSVDGSSVTLRSSMTGTAGLDGLQLRNTGISSTAGAQDTLNYLAYAQNKVQSLLQHYADTTKTIESLQTSDSAIADTMKTAVGRMTDADMSKAAAQLKAAQARQQLAVQSLSIANQTPQLLLSLFR